MARHCLRVCIQNTHRLVNPGCDDISATHSRPRESRTTVAAPVHNKHYLFWLDVSYVSIFTVHGPSIVIRPKATTRAATQTRVVPTVKVTAIVVHDADQFHYWKSWQLQLLLDCNRYTRSLLPPHLNRKDIRRGHHSRLR